MTEQTLEQLHAELDDAIEDGDLVKMDEVSQQIHDFEQGVLPESNETNVAEADETADDDASRSDDAEGEDKAEGEKKTEDPVDDKPEGVLSKGGDRVIPYEELEKARQRAADLEKQVETMRTNPEIPVEVQDQLSRMTRLVETYEGQIKANGLNPKTLPEEFTLDADKLKELEEYGTVGEMAAELARQNQYLLGQIKDIRGASKPVEQPSAEDPNVIVQNDPDLSRWSQSDFAWSKATAIDGYVKTLPEFAGKSLSERKDEVVRRTKIELGETTATTQDKAPSKSADEIVKGVTDTPTSLSEIGGGSARQEATFAQQTDGKSELEIAQIMADRLARGERIDDLL